MDERFICHIDRCASGNTFHKNTTIFELPNGDLLSAWFAGGVGEGNRDQGVFGSRLPAGADEWEDSRALAQIPGRAVGCPVIFRGPDESIWMTCPVMYGDWLSTSKVFFKRSLDEGETYHDMELLCERTGIYLKNKPLVLEAEDRWILPAYSAVEDKPYFFLISEDYTDRPSDFPPMVGGDQIVSHDPEGYMEALGMTHPTMVKLSDGSLLAYLRPRQDGHIYETRSFDGGYNWTEAEQTDIPNPNAAFDMVYTEDENLVLIDNPVSDHDIPAGRNKLALFMSEDEGDSWPYQLWLEYEEPDTPLHDLPDGERPEFTYGNIIQASDGVLHLAYEHRRRGIKHVEITEAELREGGTDEIVPALID